VNPFAPGIYYDGPFSSDHTVSLSAYRGPSVSVQYRITGIDWGFTQPDTPFWTSHTVTLYYTGSGDGSPLAADAIWTPTAPGDPWQQYDTRQVSNNDGFPGYWVYYVKGGTPTTTLGEENWTDEDQEAVGPEWTFID